MYAANETYRPANGIDYTGLGGGIWNVFGSG